MLVQMVNHMSVFSQMLMKWWNDLTVNPNQFTITKSIYKFVNDWYLQTSNGSRWRCWIQTCIASKSGFVRQCESDLFALFLLVGMMQITGAWVWRCIFGTHLYRIAWEHWKHMRVQFISMQDASSSQHECKKSLTVLTRFIDNQRNRIFSHMWNKSPSRSVCGD